VSFVPKKIETKPGQWVAPVIGGAVGSTALVRALNERSLLDLLRSNGPTSRVELARTTGLSKPTVSTALSNLVEYGLVFEAGAESGKPGPAAIIYEAASDIAFVMSIDIGRRRVSVNVADLSGTIRSTASIANRAKSAPALAQLVRSLIDDAFDQLPKSLLSQPEVTVVGGPGIPDVNTGSMRVTSAIPGWGKRGFLNELQDVIGGEVIFENDVNLAAVGEHTHGAAQGIDDFVLVSIGTGIGCGIVVRGELLRGASGAAGEMGFLPIGPTRKSPKFDRTVGQFESLAAADGIVTAASELGLHVQTALEVFDAARHGNSAAKQVVNSVGELIGQAITSLVVLIDPEVVLIGGGIGESLELLRPGIERSIQAFSPSTPTIRAASLGPSGALLGGITMALPLARERVLERLTSGS
jgi:predicted NBD/HSP70 family sugar kinase